MLILISGWKRSGKDTTANILTKNHNFVQLSFASALKDAVSAEYGIDRASLDDQFLKEIPIKKYPVLAKDSFTSTIHELLKYEFKREDGSNMLSHGSDSFYWTGRALCIFKGSSGRAVSTSFWVDKVSETANSIPKVVISDFRYKSEYEAIKAASNKPVYTIRVNRFDSIDTNDPSERDLDNFNFDFVIDNKTSLQELEDKVNSIIKGLNNV